VAALQAQVTSLESRIAAIEAGSGESRAAYSAGSQNVAVTTADVVVRSVTLTPTADGKVIATAAATVVRGTLSAVNVRCSITTGSAVDSATAHYAYFGASTTISDFQSLVGTRGFDVVKGVPVTVRFVCETTVASAGINFSSLTAVFAPN
jgi:hypothetical protein